MLLVVVAKQETVLRRGSDQNARRERTRCSRIGYGEASVLASLQDALGEMTASQWRRCAD